MTQPEVPETRWLNPDGTVMDEDHRGLVYDVQTMVNRRRALGLFGGVALTTLLAACAPTTSSSTPTATPTATPTTPSATPPPTPSATVEPTPTATPLTEIPDETGGPYPADNSNGVNILDDSGIVRSDIRSSFGSSTTTAQGVHRRAGRRHLAECPPGGPAPRRYRMTVDRPYTMTRSSACQRTARAKTRRSTSWPRRCSSTADSAWVTRVTSCSMIGPSSRSAVA